MKNILITGSTDGIGKLAAIKLAKEGHRIYLHGRNAEKLEGVISELKTQTKNENISSFVADFSDLETVRNMAQEVNAKLDKLDVLINNAGVFKSPKSQNEAGLDLRMVVNYLAPYVLTNALIPLLEQVDNSRIINLSSAAQAPVSEAILTGKTMGSAQETYAQSKLALTMWSFQLAKKLKNIQVLAVNPGSLLNTNMVREAYGQYWSSADKGANILYDLALSEEYQGVTGQYFDNDKGEKKGRFGEAHSDAYDEGKIERLMEITEVVLKTVI